MSQLGGDLAASLREAERRLADIQAMAARYGEAFVPVNVLGERRELREAVSTLRAKLDRRNEAELNYLTRMSEDAELRHVSSSSVNLAAVPVAEQALSSGHDVLLQRSFSVLPSASVARDRRATTVYSSLTDALAGRGTRLHLVGPPGGGKTVSMWQLVLRVAEREATSTSPSVIPIMLDVAEWSRGVNFVDWLDEVIAVRWDSPELAENLAGLAREGRLLLAIDALDQLPRAARAEMLDSLRRYLRELPPDNRVVFSSRPSDDYGLGSRYKRLELLPLDEDGVAALWTTLLGESKAIRLIEQVRESFLFELCEIPYFAALVAIIQDATKSLPSNLGDTIGKYVETLLAVQENRGGAEEYVRGILGATAALAFEANREVGGGSTLATAWGERRIPDSVDVQGVHVVIDKSRALQTASRYGLGQISADGESFRFPHRLLEAWLVGLELRRRFENGEDCTEYWTPGQVTHEPVVPVGSWRPILQGRELTGWELPTVLAVGMDGDTSRLVSAVHEYDRVLALRCFVEGGATVNASTAERLTSSAVALLTESEQSLPFRVEAADYLGSYGDPRLPASPIAIPAGTFIMGAVGADPYDSSVEPHSVQVDDFLIARFPVTVSDYEHFVRDGGYHRRELWTVAGWTIAEQRGWSRQKYWGQHWERSPSSPVVGVSWYEAMAYATWRNARLPTEAEWERAAGYDPDVNVHRRYPWGDAFEAGVCNCRAGLESIGRTTPVGVFPRGRTATGVEDMAGNVWEWCSSEYRPYPYIAPDGRERLQGEAIRVRRGGCFWSNPEFVGTHVRFRGHPAYRYDVTGIRLAWDPS